ncbi:hypothetical protein Tco_1428956 [Tanacetum coccineum]
MSTPIDFSAFVMNHLKIDNLTQQHLVAPTFNLLNGTCKSRVELEYHFEECYKAVTDRLDWTNPEVPADYFINNNLKYLKGGSLSRKYTTSITKTRAAKYNTIEGIEDMVQTLWSPVKIAYDSPDALSFFKSEKTFTWSQKLRRTIILTKPETFISNISKLTPYTAYKNPQGIIYLDKLKRNKLIRSDELYKFCDGTLTSVQRVLHDIASSLEMGYFPKITWTKLDRKRSRIMIKAID